MASQLSKKKLARVIAAPGGGNSIRAAVRMAGAAKNLVLKLLKDIGEACVAYQNQTLGMTPAQAAGVAAHRWTIEELVRLLDSN